MSTNHITRYSRNQLIRLCVAGAFAALAFALALPAHAGDESFTIRFHSDELASPVFASQVYQRIENAAEAFCESPGRRSLAQTIAERKCSEEMIERAIEKIDSPVLTVIHDTHGHTYRVSRG